MSEYMNQIGRLSKRLAAAGDQIESQRLALEDLREENYRLERILQAPLSLKDLEVAWEAAEEATECRKGDVLIVPGGWGGYTIWAAERGSQLRAARILSRAPREPWQDLADILMEDRMVFEDDVEGIVKRLHERGVRVTGGDDE